MIEFKEIIDTKAKFEFLPLFTRLKELNLTGSISHKD